MPIYILIFAGGFAAGLVLFFIIRAGLKQQLLSSHDFIGKLQLEKESLLTNSAKAESKVQYLDEELRKLQELQSANIELQKQNATLQSQLNTANDKLLTQKEELQQIGDKFQFEFRNLAQGILEEKTAKFTQLNEEKMNGILGPLKTELGEFRKKVDETYDRESKERFTLGKEVQRLVEMSQLVSQEANNLTTALKGSSKQQGNWGEMILESILEHSGMVKGREFLCQEFIKDKAGNIIRDDTGKGLQPDIIVCYPDSRRIIIDSKVSLIAWDRYISCTDKNQQDGILMEHIRSIRSHIDGLCRKNYPRYADALDYVLMFIPIEPAFLEAVKTDIQLWKYAYDKKIMLISPTNLLAVLKIIADLWKVERQNKNAIEIAYKAGTLYDKFVGFVENLEQVGRKLQDAQQAYETAFRQISTGKGNLVSKVEELKKMGANAEKQLPGRLITDTGEE